MRPRRRVGGRIAWATHPRGADVALAFTVCRRISPAARSARIRFVVATPHACALIFGGITL